MYNPLHFWQDFITAKGLKRVIRAVESTKTELHNANFWTNRKTSRLILAIRLEHLQIKKHQKIALKYLAELEKRVEGRKVKQK